MKDPSSTGSTDGTTASEPTRSRAFAYPDVDDLAEEGAKPVLVLIWSDAEPWRLGEALIVEAQASRTALFGRGTSPVDGFTRISPCRMRPGEILPTAPFKAPSVSRRQLELSAIDAGRIFLNNVGRCRMSVNGAPMQSGVVHVGDVIELEGQLAFLVCSRSPTFLPWPAEVPRPAFPFGLNEPHGGIGESPTRWRLRLDVGFTAPRDWEHVLILGPTGSGKEATAALIHRLSPREGRPWVEQQANLITSELASNHLFGNRRGEPVPNMPAKPGLISSAHQTTLYLDEFPELTQDVQSMFLRVMESGTYTRVGEAETRDVDVRFILATNRPRSAVKNDVAARCKSVVRVPALEACREDIVLIARAHLLEEAGSSAVARRFLSKGNGLAAPRLSPRAARILTCRAYPENVRELHSVLSIWMKWSLMRGLDYIEAPSEEDAGSKRPSIGAPSPAPPPPPPFGPSTPAPDDIDAQIALFRRYDHQISRMTRSPELGISSPQTLTDLRRCLVAVALERCALSLREALEYLAGEPYDPLRWKATPGLRRLESAVTKLTSPEPYSEGKRLPGYTEAAKEASRRLKTWIDSGAITWDLDGPEAPDSEPEDV